MMERLVGWFRTHTTKEKPLLQDIINPNARPELHRLAGLIDDANLCIGQGGDAALEQRMKNMIANHLKEVRKGEQREQLEAVAIKLQVTNEDLFYAEVGILESDKFFELLPRWAAYFGYDSKELEQKAETIGLQRK